MPLAEFQSRSWDHWFICQRSLGCPSPAVRNHWRPLRARASVACRMLSRALHQLSPIGSFVLHLSRSHQCSWSWHEAQCSVLIRTSSILKRTINGRKIVITSYVLFPGISRNGQNKVSFWFYASNFNLKVAIMQACFVLSMCLIFYCLI